MAHLQLIDAFQHLTRKLHTQTFMDGPKRTRPKASTIAISVSETGQYRKALLVKPVTIVQVATATLSF